MIVDVCTVLPCLKSTIVIPEVFSDAVTVNKMSFVPAFDINASRS